MKISQSTAECLVSLLENLSKENSGLLKCFNRWAISDEPLRSDAALVLDLIRKENPMQQVIISNQSLRILYPNKMQPSEIDRPEQSDAFELQLRPYHGRLWVARSIEGYQKTHELIFDHPDVLTCAQAGRFSGGEGNDGLWTYLIWADEPHTLAHELSHAILHVFERCGMDPRESNGEPFCYMLSQLLMEALEQIKPTEK